MGHKSLVYQVVGYKLTELFMADTPYPVNHYQQILHVVNSHLFEGDNT